MRFGVDTAQRSIGLVQLWWQLPNLRADDLLSGELRPLTEQLAHDPLLKSIEQMWKANPLHHVIPLDWVGIAWALRTVWLHSLTRPDALPAFLELHAAVGQCALDIWSEAGRRWWGEVSSEPAKAATTGDKRFAAPEWNGNAFYRMLKEVYLLASDWLLKHGDMTDMGDADRLRLNFHLRQFVDAMSPVAGATQSLLWRGTDGVPGRDDPRCALRGGTDGSQTHRWREMDSNRCGLTQL